VRFGPLMMCDGGMHFYHRTHSMRAAHSHRSERAGRVNLQYVFVLFLFVCLKKITRVLQRVTTDSCSRNRIHVTYITPLSGSAAHGTTLQGAAPRSELVYVN
jgi:hypothetical protein